MPQASRLSPVICLVAASALWGGATVLNKALLSSVPPVPLLVIQLAASTLCLLVFVALQRRRWPTKRAAVPLALLGVLNPGISYTLGLVGLVHVSASTTTLLWASEPILIVAIATIVLREPVTPRLALVIAAGLLGVLFVTGTVSGLEVATGEAMGIALLLSAVACCAVYIVFSRLLIQSADPVITVTIQQAAGLTFALAMLSTGPFLATPSDLFAIPMHLIAASALSGLMYYAIAYGLFLSALRVVPAGIASGYYSLIPLFGVGFAFVLLEERLSVVQILGAAIIVASASLLVRMTGSAELRRQG